jgi:probable phosphoglycerate mutase
MSDAAPRPQQVVLARHAETEWSRAGRHTGRTDIPLTEDGRKAARALAPWFAARSFELVLVSPLRRARETCQLCGLGDNARVTDDLREWDYGEYEGLTSAQIQAIRPGWSLWRDGCPGGEDAAEVGERADRAIALTREAAGAVAAFAHGHILRVLGARWIEQDPELGGRLALSPGSLCALGYEHDRQVFGAWNTTPGG